MTRYDASVRRRIDMNHTMPRSSGTRSCLWGRMLEGMVVFSILGLVYGQHVNKAPLHADESDWIASSCYWEALWNRDFKEPRWLAGEALETKYRPPEWANRLLPAIATGHVWSAHYWTLTQPPVTRYIVALGRLAGGYSIDGLNIPWNFSAGRTTNSQIGAQPLPDLLWYSRAVMSAIAAIAGLVLFLLVRNIAGAAAGYAFVLLYTASPYLLTTLRRAMSEAPLLLFTVLFVWAGARHLTASAAQPVSRLRTTIWLVTAGLATGLAGATKINGLLLGAAGVALCAAAAREIHPWNIRLRTFALWTGVFVFAVGFAFTIVNPFLYPNPPSRTLALFLFRRWYMTYQAANIDIQAAIPDLHARLCIVPRRLFEDHMAVHWWPINALFSGIGLYVLGRSAWQWWHRRSGHPASFAILAAASVTVPPALMTPLDWERYYLYPVIFIHIGIAIGCGSIIAMAWRWATSGRLRPFFRAFQ